MRAPIKISHVEVSSSDGPGFRGRRYLVPARAYRKRACQVWILLEGDARVDVAF